MAESVGNIYYEVDAQTQGLIDAERQVDRSTRRMEKGFGRADTSVKGLVGSLGELKTIVTAVAGAMAVQRVIQYADAWTALTNKLKIVSDSQAEYNKSLDRTFAIAKASRSSFSGTVDLYTKLARTNRTLGRSQKDVYRVTETVAKAVALSGVSAQAAEGAIVQFAQALSGDFAAAGQEINSILEQTPGLAEALAKGLGTTSDKIKIMAQDGELSARKVFDALLRVGDYIDGEFNKTVATFGQNWQDASDNMLKFVGESQAVTTVVRESGEAIVVLSENLDELVTLATLAAAVIGGHLINSLGASSAAYIKSLHALHQNHKAGVAYEAQQKRRAAENLRVAQSEQAAAQRALANARSTAALTGITTNQSKALHQLAVANQRVAGAQTAAAASTEAYAAAVARANVFTKALRGSMALLGGPAGVVMLGAWAIYELSSASKEAASNTDTLRQTVDEFTKSLENMTQKQAAASLIRLGDSIEDTREELRETTAEVSRLQGRLQGLGPVSLTGRARENAERDLTLALERQEEQRERLNTGLERQARLQDVVNGKVDEGTSSANESAAAVSKSVEEWEKYIQKLEEARDLVGATAQQEAEYRAMQEGFTGTQAKIAGLIAAQTEAMQSYQSAIEEGDSAEAAAHLNQAQRYAEKQAMLEQQLNSLQSANSLLANVQTNLSAIAVASAATVAGGAEAATNRVQEILDSLKAQAANIRINTKVDTDTSGQKSAAEQAQKRFESLQRQLETENETIDREYAERSRLILRHTQRGSDEQLELLRRSEERKDQQRQAATERLLSGLRTETEKIKAEYDRRRQEILAATAPGAERDGLLDRNRQARDRATGEFLGDQPGSMTGGQYDDQYSRYEQDAEQEKQRYAEQLQRLVDAREQQLLTQQEYNQREEQAAQTHADRLQQIEQAKSSMMLATASDMFGSMADAAKGFAGEQSGIYKAMFAASKAFAIADASLKMGQFIASAAALPWPANLGAMASAAAQGGKILSSIQSVSYGGGRQYGGNVSAGNAYRVTEDGRPEMLTQGTQRYLIPGSSGKMTANKDMGGNTVVVNAPITVEAKQGVSNAEAQRQGNQIGQAFKTTVIQILRDQQRPGGVLAKR